jgi:hypothetical protein
MRRPNRTLVTAGVLAWVVPMAITAAVTRSPGWMFLTFFTLGLLFFVLAFVYSATPRYATEELLMPMEVPVTDGLPGIDAMPTPATGVPVLADEAAPVEVLADVPVEVLSTGTAPAQARVNGDAATGDDTLVIDLRDGAPSRPPLPPPPAPPPAG